MNSTKDQWNTSLYNEKHSFVYKYGTDLIELLDPKSDERILDIGCGTGELTAQIQKSANEIVGLDNSSSMINEARRNYPDCSFVVEDIIDMNFENPFDSIFSNAALHWVKAHKKAISSMYNSVKQDGKLVLEFGGKGNVQLIINQLRTTLSQFGYTEQAKTEPWYFPSIGEYSSELEKAGFRVLFGQHFDRPTELADEENGVLDWLSMFGMDFFKGINTQDVEAISKRVQAELAPTCLKNGKWIADYKRIRIVAVKE